MTTKRMIGALVLGAGLLAACGSSDDSTAGSTGSESTSSTAPASSSEPGASLAIAKVGSLGSILVDGRGRTVYVLTADGKTNAPCDGASGCTTAWPDVALPAGVTASKAGDGVDASLLGTTKVGDTTYPTYNGWLLYEFAGDSATGQANGQGIKSFGGTWYVLNAKGTPVTAAASSGGSGY